MAKLKANIRNLFNCKRVCGVCLNKTRNLRLEDTVYSISCGETLSEKSLRDIVLSIFGAKITTLLPTSYFCESCIDVILQAYRMLEEIKFNHHILQYYTNKLTEQLKMKLPDDVQSIVFELDYPNDLKSNINYSNVDPSNDTSDYEDDIEENSNKSSVIKSEKVEIENIKQEPKQMPCSKIVTLEINEIMEKIKDQITFKKLKTENTNDCDIKKENMNNNIKTNLSKSVSKVANAGLSKKGNEVTDLKNKRFYKCYLCETTFTGESELLKHSRKLCVKSNQGLNQERSTVLNSQTVKESNERLNNTEISKEVCDQCGKVVASTYLRKHKRLHKFVQKQCTVCAQFINKASYNRHMESHSGLPKLKYCPNCNYETKFSESLDAHINKAHLHIRPYSCDTCGKCFHSKLLVREHVKIHTRLKTEQCHICGDRFSYKKSLVLHMRIHTGYKPYKCDFCEESFLSASRRQIHKQTKHSGRNFKCDLCSKKFFIRTTLRAHINKVHDKKNREKIS